MDDEYMDTQEVQAVNEAGNNDSVPDPSLVKDFGDSSNFDDGYDEDESGNNFRGNRGRGNFR